jgi:hypothetical protein
MPSTLNPQHAATGFAPEPLSPRIFIRCYRHYGEAQRAYDQLAVVAHIPDKRMTVVARGLEWRESLPVGTIFKLCCGFAGMIGAVVGLLLWAVGLTAADTGWLTQTVLGALVATAVGFVIATVVARLRTRRAGVVQTGHVEPRQYDILVEEDLAPAARAVLGAE